MMIENNRGSRELQVDFIDKRTIGEHLWEQEAYLVLTGSLRTGQQAASTPYLILKCKKCSAVAGVSSFAKSPAEAPIGSS